MGLLDSLAGGVLSNILGGGQQQQGQSPLLGAALGLIQQNGGLPGLISMFEQSGLGQHAQSWVGNSGNLPISADQIKQVLGSGAVAQIASQLGMDHGQVAGGLAQLLPQLVSSMTPNGQVPANHADLLSQALGALSAAKPAT